MPRFTLHVYHYAFGSGSDCFLFASASASIENNRFHRFRFRFRSPDANYQTLFFIMEGNMLGVPSRPMCHLAPPSPTCISTCTCTCSTTFSA